MKLCPNCQANVEGLLERCDCCGAPLDQRIRLIVSGVHDVPECLGLASTVFRMTEELEPENPEQYSGFLKEVFFRVVCYPESISESGKSKYSVRYSAAKKEAVVTIIIDYSAFVFADHEEKTALVAQGMYQGAVLLQNRLRKSNHSIEEITQKAEAMHKQFMKS